MELLITDTFSAPWHWTHENFDMVYKERYFMLSRSQFAITWSIQWGTGLSAWVVVMVYAFWKPEVDPKLAVFPRLGLMKTTQRIVRYFQKFVQITRTATGCDD